MGDLDESKAPAGFEFRRFDDRFLFYKLVFDEHTNFTNVLESIKIDTNLYVQLQYNGVHIPLFKWFVQAHNAQLTRISVLESQRAVAGADRETILTQYHSGEYVGADEEGNMYKEIVAFMIVGLKESIPYVVQVSPEMTFNGLWLAEKMV